MLLNEYKIKRADRSVEKHYEYRVEIDAASTGSIWISPGVTGIGLVEKYASRILGCPVGFFLIQGSRFFTSGRPRGKQCLLLDLAISELEPGNYSVMADITDRRGMVVEVSGRMAAIDSPAGETGRP